jgi:SAM-dependent methyltransferase/uncharacterized protein YbaR (Trm112 family)
MHESLLEWLRCPSGCEAQLGLHADSRDGGRVLTGTLCCTGCGRTYPIEEGIARMLPGDLTPGPFPAREGVPGRNTDASASPFPPGEAREAGKGVGGLGGNPPRQAHATVRKLTEMQARDEQVEDYDRMWYLNLFGLVEVPAMLLHLSLGQEHTLLEAGCGTGRMTRQFAERCKRLVSVDFSWESLRVCAAKLRRAGGRNVDLVQADICHLPFKTGAFDRVVSCQVLEHVPTPESREAAIEDLARVLRTGGNLALSAYQYSLLMRLFGEKEGEHDGGIPFFRFDREELRSLLARHLVVEGMTGALVYHYIARCRKQ